MSASIYLVLVWLSPIRTLLPAASALRAFAGSNISMPWEYQSSAIVFLQAAQASSMMQQQQQRRRQQHSSAAHSYRACCCHCRLPLSLLNVGPFRHLGGRHASSSSNSNSRPA